MSISARRIEKLIYKKETTFNLSFDDKLVDFLDTNTPGGIYEKLDSGCCGIMSIHLEIIKRALNELDLDDDVKKELKDDIEWSEAEQNTWIDYYCF